MNNKRFKELEEGLEILNFSISILECWNDYSWISKIRQGGFRKYSAMAWEVWRETKDIEK